MVDASRLEAPLQSLPFPTRMMGFIERRGLVSVRELVMIPPSALLLEQNLGRKSVADAAELITAHLGETWEAARHFLRAARSEPDEAPGTPPTTLQGRWEALGATLSDTLRARPLASIDVPARLRTFALDRRLTSIDELLATSYEQIAGANNMGRGTIARSIAGLEALRDAPEPSGDAVPTGTTFRDLLRDAFRGLDEKQRLIVTQRAGLTGPPPTLAEMGELLGVSRERIRQLEAKAIERVQNHLWVPIARARLAAAAPAPVNDVAAVGRSDDLFATDEEGIDMLRFFVDDVLATPLHLLVIDGRAVLTAFSRDALEAKINELRARARSLQFPLPRASMEAALAQSTRQSLEEVGALLRFLEDEWIVDDDGATLNGFGGARKDAVLAFLRASEGPVDSDELERHGGRTGRLPPEAVFLDRGVVGLTERIPDWTRWQERLPGLVRQLMETEGPERQWTTAEIVLMLAEHAELPPWLNAWTLGSMLRDVPEVRYLGRNVIALKPEDDRIHIEDTFLEILADAGAPLEGEEFQSRVLARRGVGTNTWMMLLQRRPFLLFEDGRIGLSPRDVPGGAPAIERATAAVFECLDARQVGIRSAELRAVLVSLGAPFATWDIRVTRAILRHDGRFRLAQGGAGIGLAEWGDTRTLSQGEILRDLLERGSGAVPIGTASAAMPTVSGEPMVRGRLGLLANSIGARLDGDRIVWTTAPKRAAERGTLTNDVVSKIPEETTALFVRLLDIPVDARALQAELDVWANGLRAEAQREASHVERAQVDRLTDIASRLLADFGNANRERQQLVAAAVRYLVCVDDAETDTAMGGLDDDERVLLTVTTLVVGNRAR